jgi:integrase
MPRLTVENPAYRKHKASGQAVVTLNGRVVYLGPWGTRISRQAYDRVVGEWLANNRRAPAQDTRSLTIAELIDQYWSHVKSYYRRPDGTPTAEVATCKQVLRVLNRLYADTPASSFGPRACEAVRLRMIEIGWCRTHVNRQLARLRMLFKWAVSKELVPPSVHHGLVAVAPLRAGRCAARESEPVKPVGDQIVDATLPMLSRTVAAMVQLQRLTGARPGEICALRTGDIDRTGKVWTYTPATHKTAYRGHGRTIFIGPRAQAVLAPMLKLDPAAYVFSPIDADRRRARAARPAPDATQDARQLRQSPRQQSQAPAASHAGRLLRRGRLPPRHQPGVRAGVPTAAAVEKAGRRIRVRLEGPSPVTTARRAAGVAPGALLAPAPATPHGRDGD